MANQRNKQKYHHPYEEMHDFVFYPESWKPIKKGEKVKSRQRWQYYPKSKEGGV